MWQNLQETADLIKFTEEILIRKLHFMGIGNNVRIIFELIKFNPLSVTKITYERFVNIFNIQIVKGIDIPIISIVKVIVANTFSNLTWLALVFVVKKFLFVITVLITKLIAFFHQLYSVFLDDCLFLLSLVSFFLSSHFHGKIQKFFSDKLSKVLLSLRVLVCAAVCIVVVSVNRPSQMIT